MTLAEDPSSPGGFTGTGNGTTISTTSFTPPAASLVVALVAGETSTGTCAVTVTDNSGLANRTWRQMAVANGGPLGGMSAVWVAYFRSAPSSAMTVTATYTGLGGGRLLDVRVITGADTTQNVSQGWAANYGTAQGVTTGAIVFNTTVSSSAVYGISSCSTIASSATRWSAAVTLLTTHTNTDDNTEAASWKMTSLTGTPGSTTGGALWGSSSSAGNVVAFEIMPVGTTPGAPAIPTFVDGTVPHASDLNSINTNLTNLFTILQGGVRWQPYQAGAKGPTKPISVLICSSPTDTIGTGGSNYVHWDTALTNTDNSWSPLNNIYAVARTAGLWRFHFTAQIVGQATVGEVEAAILLNGATYPTNVVASTNANGTSIGVSATMQMSGGSFVNFQINSPTSAGTLGFVTAVAEWLSP